MVVIESGSTKNLEQLALKSWFRRSLDRDRILREHVPRIV